MMLPDKGEGLIILTNTRSGNAIFRALICAWDVWVNGAQTQLCQLY